MAVSRPLAPSSSEEIPLGVMLGWGLGSLGMSTLFQSVSVLLLRYMTDYLGIAAAAAGVMISASKLFDAFIDPAIGVASDRTRSRWGRRRPYLLIGGLACSVSFLLMFNIPPLPNLGLRTVLVEVMLLGFAVGYGLFNIPYLAMPPEMTSSAGVRTTLIGYRVAGVGLGSLFASFVGPILITVGGGGLAGHKLMAWAVATIVLVSSLGCFALTGRARSTAAATSKPPPVGAQIKLALQNKPFTTLIGVKLIGLLGQAVTFAITPFLFVEIMKTTYTVMGLFFLVYYIALILAQPLWVRLCRAYGKKAVYLWVAPLVIVATASWALARAGEPISLIFARAVVLGVLGGSTLLIIQSMLPDTIQYDYILTGLRREGMYAGVYTTIEKVAYALASGVVGVILGSFGYIASTGAKVVQPASAISAIYFLAVAPAFCMFASCLLLLRYDLPESRLAAATVLPILEPDVVL